MIMTPLHELVAETIRRERLLQAEQERVLRPLVTSRQRRSLRWWVGLALMRLGARVAGLPAADSLTATT
ncbi:hypothetical protein HRbin26_01328 [bacterium HR26]|nr:hypothetical protein HRbin26_01328 [bacterium HR26]